MVDTPQDIEIELEDGATEGQQTSAEEIQIEAPSQEPPAAEPPVEKQDDPVEDSLRKLQDQLDAERRAKADAERRANEAQREAHRFRTEAQDSNLHLVTNAMKALEQQNETLKNNFRIAMENQEFDTVAEIQLAMSANAAKLAQLENGKKALESAPKPEEPKPFVVDKVEALASQLTPRSAAWVRAHPEFAEDPAKYNMMVAAHGLVTASGTQPDTDEYFSAIEDVLRLKPAATPAQAPAADGRKPSPPAAPVSRGGSAPGTTPTRVRLSAQEREMAEMMGMTAEDYGRNKLALIKAGRLT